MSSSAKPRLPTVLVVDDELRSQEALRRTLEDDFEVFTAANAEQAQRIMETEWVQIIVCDQRMPGITGVEFLKTVRSQWPDTLRIILSGYTDAEDIIAGVNEAGIYQRERAMDIPLLAGRLLEASQKVLGKLVDGFTTEALACLAAYPWPGNVRELQNEILRMLALAESPRLGADLLAPRILRTPAVDQQQDDLLDLIAVDGGLKERMEALEARVLKETMIRNRWNKSRAASELGLSRVGLRNKLLRYGLDRRHPAVTGSRRLARGRPRRLAATAFLHRTTGPPRLPAQRVLRIQGQRAEAFRPRLPDGEHGLQGYTGQRRLQPAAVAWRRLVRARRLCLYLVHRTWLR